MSRVSTYIFSLFLGVLLCPAVVANDAPREAIRLSPDEAVERAISNNLSLESARVATEMRRRASDLSWNQFIPNVTIGGSFIRDDGRSTISGLPPPVPPGMDVESTTSRMIIAGQIQASLTLNLAMFENMTRLRLDHEAGLISYENAKLQLERDIRKAYNNMLLLQENITVINDSFEAAQRRVQMAEANFRAGLAPELVFLQAQVAMENMRPVIDQVENGMRLSMARFAMFLGLPYDTLFELEPVDTNINFIPFDIQELISQAASGRPEIQELRHSILILQSARRIQRNALFPSLTLGWSGSPFPSFTRDVTERTVGPAPPSTETLEIRGHLSSTFTISLGLRLHSLLPFSVDSQAIRALEDQTRIANIGLAMMIQGTEIEIYNTILALERTQATASALTQTVNLAERSHRLTEEAYRAGLQDLLQVQNAELELRQARVSMLEQQFNYLNGLIDLEYAIGVPFGTLSRGE